MCLRVLEGGNEGSNRCSSINVGQVTVCVGRRTKVLIQLFANVWARILWCFNLDVMKTNPQRPHPKSQQLFNNIHAQPRGMATAV